MRFFNKSDTQIFVSSLPPASTDQILVSLAVSSLLSMSKHDDESDRRKKAFVEAGGLDAMAQMEFNKKVKIIFGEIILP